MINRYKVNELLNQDLDFHLINAFDEVADYGRNFKLPFNVLACRKPLHKHSTDKDWGHILNKETQERYEFTPGDVHFIPYGLPIYIKNQPNTLGCSLHFTLERHPGADLFRGCRRILSLSHLTDVKEIESIFKEKNPLKARCRAESLIYRICAEILPDEQEGIQWRFTGLLREVRAKIDARWNVEMLAEKAGLSTGAFSREFSANMECTAKDFLQNELLQKAVLLLKRPGASVQSVADELNFSSPFYFSKFFKRRYGIAPMEYIRRYNVYMS